MFLFLKRVIIRSSASTTFNSPTSLYVHYKLSIIFGLKKKMPPPLHLQWFLKCNLAQVHSPHIFWVIKDGKLSYIRAKHKRTLFLATALIKKKKKKSLHMYIYISLEKLRWWQSKKFHENDSETINVYMWIYYSFLVIYCIPKGTNIHILQFFGTHRYN